MSGEIGNILEERGKRYGPFEGHAYITQELKLKMAANPGWLKLNPSMKESLEMIAHKIGRILNGDPFYDDSWKDIAGYAELVAKQLMTEKLDKVDTRAFGKTTIRRVSWAEVGVRLEALREMLPNKHDNHPLQKVKLYGIPRGGAIVVGIAANKWPVWFEATEDKNKADIMVDDILDTGETKAQTVGSSCCPFFALVDKQRERIPEAEWIFFPWEDPKELPEHLRGA